MAAKGKEFPLSIVLQTVDKASPGFASLDRKLAKFDKTMARIGKRATKVGKSLTTSLTLPIVGIGIAATKAMSDFEQGMSDVATLVDTNVEDMDAMEKAVLAIGRRTPVAVDELTSALFGLRSGGIGANDAMKILEKSAQLGVAGLGTTAEAAELVTGAINSFGLSGEKADKVFDQIFKTTKNGITTISGLKQGFGAVAGTVAATGTELDEYLSAVSALTTTTLPASVAQTQLKAVIAGLTRKTKESSAVFHKLHAKDLKDLIKKSGGLVPALEKISGALGGNEAKILKLVGSTEAMGAMMGLTGKQNKAFKDTLDDMRNGANAVDVAFAKQNKTTQAQWKRTKNSLTSAAIALGKVLAPAMEKVANLLESLSNWFEGLDDSTKGWIVTIAGVAAAVGPALFIFGKVASSISLIMKATQLLSKAILANPIGVLVAGLMAISQINGDGFITMFTDAIKFWRKQFEDFIGWIEGKFKAVAANIDDFVSWATGKESKREKQNRLAAEKLKADPFSRVNAGKMAALKSFAGNISDLTDGKLNSLFSAAPAKILGPRNVPTAADWGMQPSALGPDGGKSMVGGPKGGTSKIEVSFKDTPKGTRVKTQSDERAIDVKTGYQMGVGD